MNEERQEGKKEVWHNHLTAANNHANVNYGMSITNWGEVNFSVRFVICLI